MEINEHESHIQIVRSLLRIGAFLQKTGNRLTREFGLNQQQFVVLNEIVDRGSVHQKEIVGQLLLEKSNVSKIVRKLDADDLIATSVSSDDARVTVLTPTSKGKKRHTECLRHLNAWNVNWLKALSKDEIAASTMVLERLRHLIPVEPPGRYLCPGDNKSKSRNKDT